AALENFVQSVESGNTSLEQLQPLVSDIHVQSAFWLFAIFSALISVPFWYAPALVHWDHQSALKSLFFSVVACWRNKAAFTVYGLAWVGVSIVGLIGLLLIALISPTMLALLVPPFVLVLGTVFYASLYFTYADCFVPSDTPGTNDAVMQEEV